MSFTSRLCICVAIGCTSMLASAAIMNEPPLRSIGGTDTRKVIANRVRVEDADTLLGLIAEGRTLYQAEEVKLDGYEYCSQAVSLAERGEFRRSIRAASKALYLAQETKNDDLLALASRDLAIVFSYAGQLDKAEQFARQALDQQANTTVQLLGPVYKVLGDVAARRKKYSDAIEQYRMALEHSSQRYRPLVQASLINARIGAGDLVTARTELDALPKPLEAAQAALWLRTHAELFMAEKNYPAALEVFKQIAAGDFNAETDYYRLWAFDGMARSHSALDQSQLALQDIGHALNAFDSVRARFRSDEFKMGLFSDVQAIFDRAIGLYSAQSDNVHALLASEKSRSRALLDAVRNRAPLSDKAIANFDLAAVQRDLAPDERVVVFHSLPDKLVAWSVAAHEIREIQYDLSQTALIELIDAYRTAIVEQKQSAIDGAARLGELLLAPLRLKDNERLVVVPHGPLHYLPFSALRIQNQYVIERHPLVMSPSLAIAVQLIAKAAPSDPNLLALGNPAIEPQYALAVSELEVQRLANFFPRREVLIRESASKSRLIANAEHASVVHIAAHAQADLVDPLYSQVFLANENGRHNFLEAHEVLSMNLSRVSLVTLSACESGLGKVVAGDEALGFTWSFLSAGSSAVVASLWPVSDDASEILMTRFYQALTSHSDIARAMQQAQIAVLHSSEMAHPFFWAPFNVVGNWRMQLMPQDTDPSNIGLDENLIPPTSAGKAEPPPSH